MPKEKRKFVTRTQKWELKMALHPGLEALILRMGDGLREWQEWALALQEEQYALYKAAKEEGREGEKGLLSDFDLYSLYSPLAKREKTSNIARAAVPTNWVLESVFRKICGAYKSFFKLRQRGDADAHTIRMSKDAEGALSVTEQSRFVAIQGALNKSSLKGESVVLAPQLFPGMFVIPVPTHQLAALKKATRLAKFVISRDERDLRRSGRYYISISYEIDVADPAVFVPEDAVYVALGAACIGIVSPRGEEVIPLWRPDKHWMPEIENVRAYLKGFPRSRTRPALTRKSLKWQQLAASMNEMYRIMSAQEVLNRREVVIRRLIDGSEQVSESSRARRHRMKHCRRPQANTPLMRLLGHGTHFVLTDLVVRSKEGKLADSSKEERAGTLGLNWGVQNTGAIGYLARWLEEKVKEHGGSVMRHKLPHEGLPELPKAPDERKVPVARALREHFLSTYTPA